MSNDEAFLEWLAQSSTFTTYELQNPARNNPNPLPDLPNELSSPPKVTMAPYTDPAVSINTGNYDYRHSDEDEYTDAQLKMMTSKERRQLRNKISARNFRNRRKEYVSTLEAQLEKYKNENNQLRLEIKWVRTTMDKLQKDNDQLRLEAILFQEGIHPQRVAATPAPMISPGVTSPMGVSEYSPSFSSNPSPPSYTELNDRWDWQGSHNTYLSHAVIPEWDMSGILEKEKAPMQPSILSQYPLLAPALMSIIVSHTLTMTTDQLLANARLTPPAPISPPANTTRQSLGLNLGMGLHPSWLPSKVSEKDVKALCQLLFQHGKKTITVSPVTPVTQDRISTEKTEEEEDTEETTTPIVWYDEPVTGFRAHCPFYWLQRQLCRFVITYVVVQYPQLDKPCRDFLPICERFRRQQVVA